MFKVIWWMCSKQDLANNPAPQNGGKGCKRLASKKEKCHTQPCPSKFKFSVMTLSKVYQNEKDHVLARI